MDFLQELCSAGKFIREENNLRNRLPLSSLTLVGRGLSSDFCDIVKDELNVKNIKFDEQISTYANTNVYLYTPLLGKALGKDMGAVMGAYKQGQWTLNGENLEIAGHTLTPDLFEIRLEMKEGVCGRAFANNKALVLLDTQLTPELIREGMARDFVRLVQQLRKDKNFDISDRIELCYSATDEQLLCALTENADYISEQVLAVKLAEGCSDGVSAEIEGKTICYDAKVVK